MRVLLGLAGLVATAYGASLLLDDGFSDLVNLATWLVAGVMLHDLVLAPLVIVLVLVGSVSLWAIPVLGRFGARTDNSTLLNRPYWTGWALIAAITLLTTAATILIRARRTATSHRAPRRATRDG